MAVDLLQYVTGGMAAVGAVLGVINTWNALDRQRVKLLVRPAQGFLTTGEDVVTIEVINLSSFGVTISELGLYRRDGTRYLILVPLMNGRPLPQRLESRE